LSALGDASEVSLDFGARPSSAALSFLITLREGEQFVSFAGKQLFKRRAQNKNSSAEPDGRHLSALDRRVHLVDAEAGKLRCLVDFQGQRAGARLAPPPRRFRQGRCGRSCDTVRFRHSPSPPVVNFHQSYRQFSGCHDETTVIRLIVVFHRFCGLYMFEVDLKWPVASDYVVRPTVAYGVEGEPALYPAKGATVTLQRPLEANPSLYREFAQLDGSEQVCLAFARKNGLLWTIPGGLLGTMPSGAIGHEALIFWKAWIERIRRLIEFCEIGATNPRQALRQFGAGEFPLLEDRVGLALSLEGPRRPPVLSMSCKSLLSAIELQAIHSILGGRKSLKCWECSTWFEVGPGARRSVAKFCSRRCTDKFHNRQKKQVRS
jgi:hypothetical protein